MNRNSYKLNNLVLLMKDITGTIFVDNGWGVEIPKRIEVATSSGVNWNNFVKVERIKYGRENSDFRDTVQELKQEGIFGDPIVGHYFFLETTAARIEVQLFNGLYFVNESDARAYKKAYEERHKTKLGLAKVLED